MMTRKHFKGLAKILNENSAPQDLVDDIAFFLAEENPKFRRSIFINAVNKKPELPKPKPVGRAKISAAFRALRKKGWTAKMNFSCCSSCAWSELSEDHNEDDEIVFFHNQDNDRLKETGETWLSWSGDGRVLFDVLNDFELTPIWDGSKDTRFKISLG